jgi:predicted small metal-binding protein
VLVAATAGNDPPEIISNWRWNERPVRKTMPSFSCKDIGMACEFRASAPTEAELMKKIADHGKAVHKMERVPPDIAAKIKKAIRK